MEKLDSITAFFPAFNDGGTIASMVLSALITLPKVTDDFEVIVVNDGSKDYTREILEELGRLYPAVRVIDHGINRGYGSALRTGFSAACKSWIFYTDGDAQYDPRELVNLVSAVSPGTDVVNGYKIARSDPLHRIVIGRLYHHIVRILFGFKLRDVDCDFRLIRREVFEKVQLYSTSGTICLEMVKKFQDAGFTFQEVGVHHFHRAYGKSQFFNFKRLFRTAIQLSSLWWELVVREKFFQSRITKNSSTPDPS
ncbi:MAG: glycosyltransferase family 2 protein [Deltaproteobacteria bacterium]|nr:glycosyltransferase family 2 protein [Deltaproteobacteria bacterium]